MTAVLVGSTVAILWWLLPLDSDTTAPLGVRSMGGNEGQPRQHLEHSTGNTGRPERHADGDRSNHAYATPGAEGSGAI